MFFSLWESFDYAETPQTGIWTKDLLPARQQSYHPATCNQSKKINNNIQILSFT